MIPPLQINDVHIMEMLADAGLTNAQLEQLNACRMYLQVMTLMEVTDYTGTMLLPQAFSTNASTTPTGMSNISMSLPEWPKQVGNCGQRQCIHSTPAQTQESIYTTP